VLKEQLKMALAKRKQPKVHAVLATFIFLGLLSRQKVFLIGGFGAAPSLRSYMANFLRDFMKEAGLNDKDDKIELIPPPECHDRPVFLPKTFYAFD
jgi:hypothetical protein